MKLTVILLLCLGLAVPAAHGVVLCLNEHGELALEASLGGTCAGAQGPGPRDRATAPHGAGLARATEGCYGGCRDVSLISNDSAPLTPDSVAKRLIETGGQTEVLSAVSIVADLNPSNISRWSFGSAATHAPPHCRTVVLRL